MNSCRFEVVEFLKFYFGTLFLSTYHLPTIEQVKNTTGSGVRLFTSYKPFVSMGCVLRLLILKILQRGDDLLYLSKNKFLDAFSDRLHLLGESIAPTNLENSCLTFFEKFFDYGHCLADDEEVETLVEWSLFVVQFKEANEERVRTVLDLLTEVREHLYNEELKALFFPELVKLRKETEISDNAQSEKKTNDSTSFVANSSKSQTKDVEETKRSKDEILMDTDTKSCDCYEYEVSGDCSHVDDFITHV